MLMYALSTRRVSKLRYFFQNVSFDTKETFHPFLSFQRILSVLFGMSVRKIWKQTEFSLFQNQSEKCYHIPNLECLSFVHRLCVKDLLETIIYATKLPLRKTGCHLSLEQIALPLRERLHAYRRNKT